MDVAEAEGVGGIDENDVVIACQAAVLEAVVEEDHVGLRMIVEDLAAAGDAVGVDVDGDFQFL